MKNKLTRFILILSIIAVTYNVVLFLLAGFSNHSAAFWLSWASMMLAFSFIIGAMFVLGTKSFSLRDWLFGYPFVRHCTIYIACTFFTSLIFMIFNRVVPWQWALAVHIVILAIYLVFFISCMIAKETIQKVDLKISDKTRFIRLLRADVEMLVEKCDDPSLKKLFMEFSDAVRYSDPMSAEALFELEKEIAFTVTQCDETLSKKDYITSKELCKKALLLLSERNKKTKVLK